MDSVLQALINSSQDSDRQPYMNELILVHTTPIVRRVLRQRLGLYVNHLGANPNQHEAEDLYHEIIIKLIQVL